MSVISRFFEYARPWRRNMILGTVYAITNKFFDIAPEILIGIAVDLVVKREQSFLASLVSDPFQQVLLLGGVTLFIWVFESVFEYLMHVEWRTLAQSIQHAMRMDAYSHVQRQDLRWFESQSTGNLSAILNDDINQLERFLNGGASAILQLLASSVMVGAIFFYLSPLIGVLAILPIPVVLLGSSYFQKRLQERYAHVRAVAGDIGARVVANLRGIVTIKSFTAEPFERQRLEQESKLYLEANRSAIAWSSAFTPIIRMAILAGFLVTLVLGGKMALDGQLEVGAYSILVFLTQRLLWPFTRLAETLDLYERAKASARRVLELLDTPVEILDKPDAKRLNQCAGAVDFEDVSFSYGRAMALKGISLSVAAGQMIGLVGPTGSGKTSLIKLLLRFYDPQQGQVKLDGQPVSRLTLESLRQNIALVSQEVFLFDATIEENIRYAHSEASDDSVREAARLAGAEEFILKLEKGYQTKVGEGGVKLSGGQRQRLSIARALLKGAPILVFDEATSAVDNETEAAIQQSLERVRAGHTILVIAHRLSTVRRADHIYVLEHGEVTQQGTHEALAAQPGLYQRLWRIQTGEGSR
ncbi:MAG: ABC transporter ATP-binding protein [Myxococcota bacterium]